MHTEGIVTPTRAVLVLDAVDPQARDEFRQLVGTCGFDARAELRAPRHVHSQHYLGSGRMEELRTCVQQHGIQTVLLDGMLSPTQARHLGRITSCDILDRTDVILEIFALHARSYEAKLQVRRAQLERQSARLVRRWTHLERQRGGIGVRGGPGEAQLESDRRKLRHECRQLDKRLQRIRGARNLSRTNRRKARVPLVVLVGYTNAGKSTLFNTLSGAGVLVANSMFATLGTTLRRVRACGVEFVLADTVGFIRNLPHELIESFHATLEEVREASLLLHLTDISNEHWRMEESSTLEVLAQIDALEVPRLQIYTKADLLPGQAGTHAYRNACGQMERLCLSALSGAGMDLLREGIVQRLHGTPHRRRVLLDQRDGALQAELHRLGAVLSQHKRQDGGWHMDIMMPNGEWDRLRNHHLL
jgi:GTP-binding protein HflX